MSQLAFNRLPDLCLRQIFKCLGLQDLARCRRVCKLFKFYADQEMHELAVGICSGHWYGTHRSIESGIAISWKAFSSLSQSNTGLLKQVHFLCILLNGQQFSTSTILFQRLDAFEQVVHLELTLPLIFATLTLPNLRVFCFCGLNGRPYHRLILNTPKLEVLKCDNIWSVEPEYPETIKKLESGYSNAKMMAKFKNLEVFKCVGIPDLELTRDLSIWKQLRELDLDLQSTRSHHSYKVAHGRFLSALARILSEKATSKRELQVYLNDVLLLDANQLKNLKCMTNPGEVSMIKNYKIQNYKWLRAGSLALSFVDYNQVMNLVGGKLSPDFFEKFPSIQTVTVTGAVDRDRFGWFLKNASELKQLTLTNTSLNQAFMDRLPNISSGLIELEISQSPNSVNFDFILQLICLREFRTNQQFDAPLDLAAKVFQQLGGFVRFQFGVNVHGRVKIERKFFGDQFDLTFGIGNNRIWTQICFEKLQLSWAELVGLYEQKKRELSQEA